MRILLKRRGCDLRGHLRFIADSPVTFCWKFRGRVHAGRGTVRDLSIHGVFIVTEDCPRAGAAVRCRILLPSLRGDTAPARFTAVEMVGRILRLETAGEQIGFAVCSRAIALREELLDELDFEGVAI